MFTQFKQRLSHLKNAEPGHRFQSYYQQRHDRGGSAFRKMLLMGASVLLMLVGIVLLPAPGPGLLVVAAGAGIMAGESLSIARMLDRIEVWIRRHFQSERKKPRI